MPFKRLDVANRWKELGGADGAGATGRAMKIKAFPKNNLMAYVTGTPDGGPSEVGILRLSGDYGLSWADAPVPSGCDGCLDIDEAPNGDLWGLFYDSTDPGDPDGYTAKVAVSTNNGVSWTVKYTHTAGLQAFNLAASPKRGTQQIAFTARDAQGPPGSLGSLFNLVISTDSGNTWSVKPIGAVESDDFPDTPLIMMLASGRILVYLSALAALRFVNVSSLGYTYLSPDDVPLDPDPFALYPIPVDADAFTPPLVGGQLFALAVVGMKDDTTPSAPIIGGMSLLAASSTSIYRGGVWDADTNWRGFVFAADAAFSGDSIVDVSIPQNAAYIFVDLYWAASSIEAVASGGPNCDVTGGGSNLVWTLSGASISPVTGGFAGGEAEILTGVYFGEWQKADNPSGLIEFTGGGILLAVRAA